MVAILCFDAKYGAAIAMQVSPAHFDRTYREFVTKILRYRRRHNRPPGKTQTQYLAKSCSKGKDDEVIYDIVDDIIADLDNINPEYVANRTQEFINYQNMKAAMVAAMDRFNTQDDKLVEDVNNIFRKVLRNAGAGEIAVGSRLNDPDSLRYLNHEYVDFIPFGIKELDKRKIGLYPGRVVLYIAGKGQGKSWACIHAGKQALLHRRKALHITLEMSEESVLGRYHQAYFAVGIDSESFVRPVMVYDDILENRLVDITFKNMKSKLNYDDPKIGAKLGDKIAKSGKRIEGLIVKGYPTRSLTVDKLVAYLDFLREYENFVPDLLIVDYPKLMKITGDLRIELGRTFEDLRGLCAEKAMAGFFPHQGTRESFNVAVVKASMAGEDISVVQTADTVMTFSRTKAEAQRNLGRLSVEFTRDTKYIPEPILLVQSYVTGQYVVDSMSIQPLYWEKMKKFGGSVDEEE